MKNTKGITLIALIITIIVLLILAGVSISMLVGDDGIITQAKNAKNATEEAQANEMLGLSEIEALVEGYIEPWNGEIGTGFASGGGQTAEDPYIIENGEQLAYLASQVNAGVTYENEFIEITKSINLGNIEFTPIGIGSTGTRAETEWNMTEYSFNGTLDGKGNVITGIKITQTNMHGVGVLGVLGEKGIVKNLNTYEGTIIGKTCVGGIVGASKGSIIKCINKLTIIAQDDEASNNSGQYAGGIVGWAKKGTIENCKNYGNVTTKDDSILTSRGKLAGGIVGYVSLEEDMTISNCSNSGTVIATYQQAGGIVGSNQSEETAVLTIKNCTNSGNISTGDSSGVLNNSMVGGIIGWAKSETIISNCNNSGAIIAINQQAGGIVGVCDIGTIRDCSNSGDVKTENSAYAGGIAGVQTVGEINNCNNSGDVKTENSSLVGGIVGYMYGNGNKSISNCSNSGTITSADQSSRRNSWISSRRNNNQLQ